jgi:hypothetical protein
MNIKLNKASQGSVIPFVENTHTARFLNIIIQSALFAVFLICMIAFFDNMPVTFRITLVLFFVLVFTLILVRNSYLKAASLILLISLLVTMMITTYLGDGVHDVSVLLLPATGLVFINSCTKNRRHHHTNRSMIRHQSQL